MTARRRGGPLRFATFLPPNMLPVYRFLAERIGERLGARSSWWSAAPSTSSSGARPTSA
jgi:hypothetical protein